MAVEKSRKGSGFVIHSYFNDSAFTAAKGAAKVNAGSVKDNHLSIKRLRKGLLFCQKMVYKEVGPCGRASPFKTLLRNPGT